jgi:hypothetical protein
MKTIETEDFIVRYRDDTKTQEAIFKMVVAWFLKQEVFTSESIMQCDAPQLEGPEFLGELADRIRFDVEIKEISSDKDED